MPAKKETKNVKVRTVSISAEIAKKAKAAAMAESKGK